MRLDRVEGKRQMTFAKREQDCFETVYGLCRDLEDLNIEGAGAAASALSDLMTNVGLIEDADADADN